MTDSVRPRTGMKILKDFVVKRVHQDSRFDSVRTRPGCRVQSALRIGSARLLKKSRIDSVSDCAGKSYSFRTDAMTSRMKPSQPAFAVPACAVQLAIRHEEFGRERVRTSGAPTAAPCANVNASLHLGANGFNRGNGLHRDHRRNQYTDPS